MDEAAPGREARVVVVGASAGGVEALTRLAGGLPDDYALPVLVVLHVAPTTSALPEILTRAGGPAAEHASDRMEMVGGRIYVAPPDCHLLVADHHLRVVRGPKENGHRPAIDPLFRTAAAEAGSGVVGVVLSGTLDDGTAGLAAVKRAGGLTVVQDPDEALYPAMPKSARDAVSPDHVLSVSEIARLLVQLAAGPPDPKPSQSSEEQEAMERDLTQLPPVAVTEANREAGQVSAYTCPECNGTLWEVKEEGVVKLRCRVGHAYTENGYAYEKDVRIEAALWTALTALVERADFSRRVGERFRRSGQERSAKRYDDEAGKLREQAETLRVALTKLDAPAENEEYRAS